MKSQTEFDRIARDWLADGPTELADRVLEAALADVHVTRQRRRPGVAWRFAQMSTQARVGLSIAAVIVAVVVGSIVLRSGEKVPVGAGPSPSPSASPSTSPAAASSVGPATGPRVTCNTKGCYGENLVGLKAGPLTLEAVSQTPDEVRWDLFSLDSGYTWNELAAVVIDRQQQVAAGGRAGNAGTGVTHLSMADTSPASPVGALGRVMTAGTYFVVCVTASDASTDTGVFLVGPFEIAP